MKRKYNNLILSIIMVVTASFTINGCFSAPTETALMKEAGVKVSITEYKIRLTEFGYRFSGIVELSADEIISQSPDNEIKKQALLWKIYAIPAMIRSISINDPFAAGVDSWILSVQMLQYFEDGYGKDLFGDYQDIAITASKLIVSDIENLAREIKRGDDISRGRKITSNWTKKHPLKNNKFLRLSALDTVAHVIGSEGYSLGGTVENIAISVVELKNQVTLYTHYLPKHIKWQAEYELYNFLGDSLIEQSVNKIDRVILSTEKISNTIEESPELVKEIQFSTLLEIDKQRLETLEMISQERMAVLEAVTMERIALMEQIHTERTESLDRIEEIAGKTINQSSLFAADVIDKIFWRVLIILAVVFIGGVVTIRLYRK
jgi:hypothetical protein